jgi:hypothetical protein
MEFRLKYEGRLKTNGSSKDKHEIRQYFHLQLKELWEKPPYKNVAEYLRDHDRHTVIREVGDFSFFYYVSSQLGIVAELDITLMRPGEPGAIISSGDVDNRLKTLFDALRAPHNENEIPRSAKPTKAPTPFYCVLEDDNLITSVKVTCDRLLEYKDPKDVFLLIHVKTKQLRTGKWRDLMLL